MSDYFCFDETYPAGCAVWVAYRLMLYVSRMQCHGAEGCAVGGWRSAALEVGGRGKMIADFGLRIWDVGSQRANCKRGTSIKL
jgi:hypothetical protein